jgi:hypothetical protein
MRPIADLLKSLAFVSTHPVAGRASIADRYHCFDLANQALSQP